MMDSPRLREGMRMKLYHLTGGAKVLGYIKTKLYATAQDESIVSFELSYANCIRRPMNRQLVHNLSI